MLHPSLPKIIAVAEVKEKETYQKTRAKKTVSMRMRTVSKVASR